MSETIASRMRVSAIVRKSNEQDALEKGDENELWQSAWSMMASINLRLAAADSVSGPDPSLLAVDMHDLWHTYWHGALNTAPGSPKLDRLVLQIIQSRELGTLAATDSSDNLGTTLITTSGGTRIWTDLPFLAQDMTAFWVKDSATLGSAQRLSGAQFLALLAAAGTVADDALCGIALVVLREALETPRPLGSLTARSRDPARRLQDLSVADLLPSANAWLFIAGTKLIQLSNARRNHWSTEISKLGEIILASTVAHDTALANTNLPSQGGFSPGRWKWWLQRLALLATLVPTESLHGEMHEDETGLRSFLRGMMNNMFLLAEQTGGTIASDLRAPEWQVLRQPISQQLGPGQPNAPGIVKSTENAPRS